MNKSELKSGMIVELRNGLRYLVLKHCDTIMYGNQEFCLIRNGEFILSEDYNPKLLYDSNNVYDIMKVLTQYVNSNTYQMNTTDTPIWERVEIITINNSNYNKYEVERAIKDLKPI